MLLEKEFVACKKLDINLKLRIFSDFTRKESKMFYFYPQPCKRVMEKAGQVGNVHYLGYLSVSQ